MLLKYLPNSLLKIDLSTFTVSNYLNWAGLQSIIIQTKHQSPWVE
jgi:hypothetical protein